MPDAQRKQVGDVAALRAAAHPLRQALLGHLLAAGPQTASQCAAAVGSTPSNCSWHLRYLARAGFVEQADAAEGADGRERPWRAAATGFSYEVDEDAAGGRVLLRGLVEAGLAEEHRLVRAYLEGRDAVPARWRRAEAMSSYAVRVTPRELEALAAEIDRLVRPYIAATRDDAPRGAGVAALSVRAFLRPGS